MFGEIVETEAELETLLGRPSALVQHKVISHIDQHCRNFLAKSALLFIATADSSGALDVSPRGDIPGFVRILDENRLIIPERPGNRRFDSLRNLLSNPHIGLIFLIPGLDETLRVNGRAWVTRDPILLEPSAISGRLPVVGIGVSVKEAYVHCAKAFRRSHTWDAETWLNPEEHPDMARILAAHAQAAKMSPTEVAKTFDKSYRDTLY